MKRLLLCLLAVLIFHQIKAQNTETKIAGNPAYVKYPSDYKDSGQKQYPVIIFLPSFQEFGKDVTKLVTHGPSKFVASGENFEFLVNGKLEKPLVISVLTARFFAPNEVDAVINGIIQNFRVDKKRVYITGLDAGGSAWMRYMNFKPAFAAKIAGMVLVSPRSAIGHTSLDGTTGYKAEYFSDAGVKYWCICGTRDYMWKELTTFADSLNARKPYSAVFTDFNGYGPFGDFWDRVYNPGWKSTTNKKSIYEWLLAINQP